MKRLSIVLISFFVWIDASVMAQVDIKERKDLAVDQDLYREVAGELRCPTCTGLSVLDSEATFSVQIKNQVKEQLAQGRKHDEILKFFVDRYGPWILRAPPVQGVNALAWLVPVGLLIVGPLLIWMLVWRRKPTLNAELVRSTEDIVQEMKASLEKARSGGRL